MEKEHKMILLSADLREVHARLAKKFAGAAQVEEHPIRNRKVEVSNTSIGSNDEGPEAA